MSWILIFPQLCWVSILCPYVMSFDAIYMYITFTGKSYLSRLGLPMDWEKIFEKWKQHTVLQYIPLRGEMFVFSLLIFGLTQQRDTIDLTFCKTGQVYYRIQLNRKLRIFLVGKWCRRMKVKKAHITYIAACKVSSFCIIPFRQSSFALEQ